MPSQSLSRMIVEGPAYKRTKQSKSVCLVKKAKKLQREKRKIEEREYNGANGRSMKAFRFGNDDNAEKRNHRCKPAVEKLYVAEINIH